MYVLTFNEDTAFTSDLSSMTIGIIRMFLGLTSSCKLGTPRGATIRPFGNAVASAENSCSSLAKNTLIKS